MPTNLDFGEPLDKFCPDCGGEDLEHTVEKQPVRFNYGSKGVLAATVVAEVPVTTCPACGESWTDARAEEARLAAVALRKEELEVSEMSN
jgi:YgiT-type zinc finger domain-containing protein